MINFDALLLEFVRMNIVTISIAGGILTIIAKRLKLGLLVNIIDFLKGKMPGNK